MSLKAFHIFFILISLALSIFLGVWGTAHDMNGMVIFSVIAGVVLLTYFGWFIKKSKNVTPAIVLLLLFPDVSKACAVCFGVVDFQQRNATNSAIWFMIGVTTLMLGTVTYFVFKTVRTLQKQN